jgi:hypothetical protein
MTQDQLNFNTMLAAVLQYLADNSPEWSTNSVVNAGVKNVQAAKAAIDAKAQLQQDSNKTGYTDKKNIDYENMLTLAYRLGVRVYNYAVSMNDPVMTQAVHFSRFTLESGTEQNVVKRCTTIAEQAAAALAAVPAPSVDYKITAAGVSDLQSAIALIMPDTAERDVVGGTHIDTTATLAKLISDARTKLKMLDKLIEGMVDDDEDDFITGYEVVRRITDRRARGKDKPAPIPPVTPKQNT